MAAGPSASVAPWLAGDREVCFQVTAAGPPPVGWWPHFSSEARNTLSMFFPGR